MRCSANACSLVSNMHRCPMRKHHLVVVVDFSAIGACSPPKKKIDRPKLRDGRDKTQDAATYLLRQMISAEVEGGGFAVFESLVVFDAVDEPEVDAGVDTA